MTIESLRLIRTILLRSAGIAAILAALAFFITAVAWSSLVGIAIGVLHTDEAHLSAATLEFFTWVKFFIGFVLLVPGIAIHWTIQSERQRSI
ncbi:MAG: hypothetical protein GIW95_11565 [Candidatus Eremiobacteraeota bacterium]|nr:hypothetical protein [Candidatus Eremiobacteraeota bacterium]